MKETELTVFPVGEFSEKFKLDVVIYIYDSVNDPLRFITPCKVSTISNILALLKFLKLIFSGSYDPLLLTLLTFLYFLHYNLNHLSLDIKAHSASDAQP